MSVAVLEARSPAPVTDDRWRIRVSAILAVALALFALGNVGRVPLLDIGSRQAPLLLSDIGVLAFVTAGGVAMASRRSLKVNDTMLFATVFAAIGGLAAVAAVPRWGLSLLEAIASLAYLARWCAYFGVYVVVVNCLKPHQSERVWTLVESIMLSMAAFGIIQAIFLPNFAMTIYPETGGLEWDAQGNRLVSTILDPNIMAGLISVVLLVQLSRIAFGVHVPMWKPLLLFAALIATLSRGGLLSFAVGAFVILTVRGVRKRLLQLAAIVLAVVMVALPWLVELARQYTRFSLSDASALSRIAKWQAAFGAFLESPWFGIGFNTYGFVQDHRGFERLASNAYSAEGGLLFILVMTGLVGLSVYLLMLWSVLRRCRAGWRNPDIPNSARGFLLGVGAATVCALVNTLFVNTLLVPSMMELLWLLWGLAFLACGSARSPRMRVAGPVVATR